jgi:hypothetical protein
LRDKESIHKITGFLAGAARRSALFSLPLRLSDAGLLGIPHLLQEGV